METCSVAFRGKESFNLGSWLRRVPEIHPKALKWLVDIGRFMGFSLAFRLLSIALDGPAPI